MLLEKKYPSLNNFYLWLCVKYYHIKVLNLYSIYYYGI